MESLRAELRREQDKSAALCADRDSLIAELSKVGGEKDAYKQSMIAARAQRDQARAELARRCATHVEAEAAGHAAGVPGPAGGTAATSNPKACGRCGTPVGEASGSWPRTKAVGSASGVSCRGNSSWNKSGR